MKKQSKEILSKKTATALKAELSKYSDIFNVTETLLSSRADGSVVASGWAGQAKYINLLSGISFKAFFW